jgi:restriction system protein
MRLIAEKGPARRRDLLNDFGHFCRTSTTIQSESVIKDFLYSRLRNLNERQLIVSNGQQYEISTSGLAYLKQYADYIPGTSQQNEQQADIHLLVKQLRDNARNELQAYLLAMNPYKFEGLVKLAITTWL